MSLNVTGKCSTHHLLRVVVVFPFASFFPQIIQGPIPRYEQLNKELFEGNSYNYENIKKRNLIHEKKTGSAFRGYIPDNIFLLSFL